jgi:hypothetical protein
MNDLFQGSVLMRRVMDFWNVLEHQKIQLEIKPAAIYRTTGPVLPTSRNDGRITK